MKTGVSLKYYVNDCGLVSNVPIFNLSTLLIKVLKPLGTFFNLSISNLSPSDFRLAKSVFLAKA